MNTRILLILLLLLTPVACSKDEGLPAPTLDPDEDLDGDVHPDPEPLPPTPVALGPGLFRRVAHRHRLDWTTRTVIKRKKTIVLRRKVTRERSTTPLRKSTMFWVRLKASSTWCQTG